MSLGPGAEQFPSDPRDAPAEPICPPSDDVTISQPSFNFISRFMQRYAGRLPRPYVGLRSWEYRGTDYALVLYACFPSNCVDLSRLSWSLHPLNSQVIGNLEAFCGAALGLRLPDTPTESLNPALLHTSPSCVAHHIRVQHWLYSLSRRFKPDAHFDAVALRVSLRTEQLGEPFVVNKGADPACSAPRKLRRIEEGSLSASCGAYLAARPNFTEKVDKAEKDEAPVPAPVEKPKPWLQYSKPWRLPSKGAEKGDKTDGRTAQRSSSFDQHTQSYIFGATDLESQYKRSRHVLQNLRDCLLRCRQGIVSEIMSGESIHFDATAEILKQLVVVPDEIVSLPET